MVSVNKSITQSSLEISPIWIPIISDIMMEVKPSLYIPGNHMRE